MGSSGFDQLEQSPLIRNEHARKKYGDLQESTNAVHRSETNETSSSVSPITDAERGQPEEEEEDLKDLLQVVKETVPLHDDPTIPVLTFRFFILSFLFIVPGAFIDTLNNFRTTAAAYSIFFVQIAAHPAGEWMARTLPKKQVNLYFFSFNLNPGPWSIKETALITVAAKSGATGNLATNALALVELYFGTKVPPPLAILFMWSIVFIGYSYAAIAKNVVSYDPQFQWPQSLMQTALLQSQAKDSEEKHKKASEIEAQANELGDERASLLKKQNGDNFPDTSGHSQMTVFFVCAFALAVWQLLPEYFFPLTSSVAILCYIAPRNHNVNFIGSGLGGMGFLNLSFDWANITSQVMLIPYWVQVIQFMGFVIGAWILLPLAKWTLLFPFQYGLMSNRLFTETGEIYPTEQLMNNDGTFNETAYESYGPVHLGSQRAWNMFFDYAAYVSGVVWVVAFAWNKLQESWNGTRGQYNDRLNKLHRAYDNVPYSWYGTMFCISMCALALIHQCGYLFTPLWTCIGALIMGSIIVTPLMWLYALSNFQLPTGTFNELLYGYIVQNKSPKHPGGAAFFGCIAGNAWYRAQIHLELMKLGFYNHLPPKSVFFAQIMGEFIGVPVNYMSFRWVLSTKWDYLVGKKTDPLHQWTGQTVVSYHTNAILYVVLGPRRLFLKYPALPYGFLAGLFAPLVVFCLHKRFPRSKLNFQLWNTTVLFSTLSTFYGNVSTGFLSKFIGGTFTMFYAYRHKHALWKKYNYVVAAALDTGFNLSMSFIFILVSLGINAPVWFGNNPQNVERCFAL
ncbi:OPT superfamily oligopeptide transporter [Metschnikowia bicuspidata var. bicuspidata NRRL YB-4993]|uniref:OPT superfamily oligopeptide transporter n=1 Tax=Metschnikowia bicuspidata var. bicuspidata NRRL YB-4993 TaxID=869754 RepID=A0A1A0H6G4_9ASCO|nr:OPT superfamily oligopeptide transporter [Metschnikowia bicuspidata var. bicuspidata NRRL YB-4993]OBA19674.1 OPT superfamily oligopeptide transporter [Metschnikowia bicuspidata var. bicuspidata NRRL YB-4993]